MTYLKSLLVTATILSCAATAFGQNARITHTITKQVHAPASMGRDLWFSMIGIGSQLGNKYYNLYVTSPQVTNVYVNMAGQATKVLPVQPFGIASFNIPLSWEIQSSSIKENKAIHVWSNDGDVCAYLMSHNDYTSDGMYIIPAIGWGTDNVVAAYGALYEGFATYFYDDPSEMIIVANQDNTICSITPSCDFRLENSWGSCVSCVGHPKGITFFDTLQKGQAIQYLSMTAQDADNFDMTGTIIHSNKPIGVVGGSMCTNISMGYPYCDHVCDMMPPQRTWGRTYISAPFYPANPGKQWSTFLVVGTKANQLIYRTDPVAGRQLYCTLDSQYHFYWRNDIDQPSKWESADPFMLVQYINSATYPDGVNAQGDPAEVVLPPVEEWPKSVVFQVAGVIGNESPYKNYVNILVNNAAIQSTKFGGSGIAGSTHLAVDANYSVFRFGGLKPGAYEVRSDSGVGIYSYGYGYDESYAWGATTLTGTLNSPDTVPPTAVATGQCFDAHVALTDTGNSASHLNFVRLDSVYNMAYNRTDANWQEGTGRNTSYYDMYVIDSSKPAVLNISVFDVAGNLTTINSAYQPQFATIAPLENFFGTGNIKGTPIYVYDTLTNKGRVPFIFSNLHLVLGKTVSGMNIDSAVLTPLAVGEKRVIKISFVPINGLTSYDTVVFGDSCVKSKVMVYGSGGGADFRLTNYDFGIIPIKDATNSAGFDTSSRLVPVGYASTHIYDLAKTQTVSIDSVWTDDPHFTVDPSTKFPFTLDPTNPGKGDTCVKIHFKPTQLGTVTTLWHAHSNNIGGDGKPLGVRSARLSATSAEAGQKFFGDTTVVVECAASGDAIQILDTILATGTLGSDIRNIQHSAAGDQHWTQFIAYFQNGTIADFSKSPEHLNQGDILIVSESFQVPIGVTKTFSDTITATFATGDSAKVHATIQTNYVSAALSPTSVRFPMVPYKSAPPPPQSFAIQNTGVTDLTITSVYINATEKYADAFALYPSIPLPVTLHGGASLQVEIMFEPSFSPDSNQFSEVRFTSNACVDPGPVGALAQSTAAGVAESSSELNFHLESTNGGRILRATFPTDWSGPVHLELDDLLGVKVLGEVGLEATTYATFEVKDVASGLYFYRLNCGAKSAVGKVIIAQ